MLIYVWVAVSCFWRSLTCFSISLSAPRNVTRPPCSLVTDEINTADDTCVINVNEKWNINRLHVRKAFYHTSGSGLRTSQKHQPCEEALMNVWAREAQRKREKERKGIVCRCLGQGSEHVAEHKQEACCLDCGFQFLMTKKTAGGFACEKKCVCLCVSVPLFSVCLYTVAN